MTSSFDPSSVCENPACAATRDFGIISPLFSYTQIEQDIKQTETVTFANSQPVEVETEWRRDVQIQRYEAIFAGKKGRFVPEFYVSQNYGVKKLRAPGKSNSTKNTVEMLNNQLNLAYSASDSFKLGVKLFTPSIKFKDNDTTTYSNIIERFERTAKFSTLGTGVGLTIRVFKGVYIGWYHNNMLDEEQGRFTRKTNDDAVFEQSYNVKGTSYQSGSGLVFQGGNSKNTGFRAEVSWSTMYIASLPKPQNNSQGRVSVELSRYGFTGGLSATQITRNYLNYRNYIDYVMADVKDDINDKRNRLPTISYSGFVGFKTKNGSSISGYATFSSGKADVALFGSSQPAKVTKGDFGLSYAYYF